MNGSLAEGVRLVPTASSLSGTAPSSGSVDFTVSALSGWVFGRNGESMKFSNMMSASEAFFGYTGDGVLDFSKFDEQKSRNRLVSLKMDGSPENAIPYAMEQNRNPWLVNFLVNGGEKNPDPNSDIAVII